MILVEEGELLLDHPVHRYVKESDEFGVIIL
jgi:CubicO group peptidase (beta-lactamase class C family)